MSGPHVEDPAYRPGGVVSSKAENGPEWIMPAPGPFDWTPSAGMETGVASGWRTFYRHIRDVYGVTPQQYRDLYVAQHGCCFICRKAKGMNPDDPKGRGSRRLAVDHNHVTGDVRGLLCSGGDKTCNRIIGWLSVEALRRAVAYVETPPASVVRKARHEMDAVAAQYEGDFPDEDGFLKTRLGLR